MIELPRYVVPRDLAGGQTAYYFNTPEKLRKLKCPIGNEPLGSDYAAMKQRAETLNGMLDEWSAARNGLPTDTVNAPRFGTIDWLFREYRQSDAYLKKVAVRSRQNYEWAMREVCDIVTKKGDRVGGRMVKTVGPRGADKLLVYFNTGKDGQKRLRTGHKLMMLCRKAWKVVHRLHPAEFDKSVPNPWMGATLEKRVITQKAAVTRDQVYSFAYGAIKAGEPEAAAVAVICFEWLQRPENVIAGHIKWSGYRNPKPIIRVFHHKTNAIVDHPLEELQGDGTVVKFYDEAEEILGKLTRRGVSMILREVEKGKSKPFAFPTMQHKVQRLRKELGLPSYFTFDACRHGGMTELEEAELTEGQGRALSAHKTSQAYSGYAKRTEKRMLSATRKRHAHKIADKQIGDGEVAAPNDYAIGKFGYVYFAKCRDRVKIGFSKHVPTRLDDLSLGSPESLQLLHFEVGTKDDESALHDRFSRHHVRREWFELSDEIRSYIAEAKKRTSVRNRQ